MIQTKKPEIGRERKKRGACKIKTRVSELQCHQGLVHLTQTRLNKFEKRLKKSFKLQFYSVTRALFTSRLS